MILNRFTYVSCLLLVASTAAAQGIRPDGAEPGQLRWQELGNRTDTFNGSTLDTNKWVNNPSDLVIGAWSFDENNAYVADGKLNIAATQETHTRAFADACWDGVAGGTPRTVQRELYYKSGAVKSTNDGIYGYYEASIKGVKVFPGLSPAFWLYSDGHPYNDAGTPGSVDYSEIDIVELQQADWHGPGPNDADPINVSDHNLHARIFDDNGNRIWLRPKPNPATQLLNFEADHDPSDDFHTYAVENRRDRIFWYVDGELIGSKPNTYWHRPMHVIFSMGMRRQFIYYNASCQRADPNPNNITSQGFPEDATMQVDYVKTWEVQPSVWLENRASYENGSFSNQQSLDVEVNYHGGSNHHVVAGNHNGLVVNLVEKNADGFVRIAASGHDSSVTSSSQRYGGKVTISLDIDQVPPSADLPAGHFYALAPVFTSSAGQDVFIQTPLEPVTITGNTPTEPNPDPQPGNNTPQNGSFESGNLNGWTVLNGQPRTNNDARQGNRALTFDGAARLEQTIAIQPSTQYQLSAWGKVATAGDNFVVGIKNISAGQSSVQFKNTGYQQKSLSFTTGANDSSATIYINNGQEAHSATVDGISVSGGSQGEADVGVTGIQVTPENLTLATGQTQHLNATVQPTSATNKRLTWMSDSPGIASVSAQGVVTAHASGGPVTITAISDNGLFTDSSRITVSTNTPPDNQCPNSWVAVTGVSLGQEQLNLTRNQQYQLNAVVTPSCATNPNVAYTSSDASVVSVTGGGNILTRRSGTATITVRTKNGGHTDTVDVRVD
ncbi:Ig-like domain-containing protein [Gilvimarinus agarilyticus]|uniref:Ig-like domain-containing protein n=1 Tax=Gilvimarinus sp. 2_MG-2023 TaxID=3062666 RepID=UPI001C08FFC5|nr:Ig-like domain-containing protein [Gilvimarinus sp. 2_MG-2023]MBU2886371.1 Ig-like domain-containing protein [Gilvimarinus agarilyticus]MDO6571050.1 Ig-like domain-containing protein [Gilvimarinus sp. 2_MG-2023]